MSTTPSRIVRMSGALACDELLVLRKQIGDVAYAQTIAALAAEVREDVLALTSVATINVEHIKAVFVAAAKVTGRAPEEVHHDAVFGGTEHTFRNVWRLLLRVTTDNAIITRVPAIYAKSYDIGTLTARITAPGRAEFVLDGWPDGEEFSMRGVGIATEATLTLAGRKDVKAKFYRTANGARFLVSWAV